jgi:hypothetical protein
VPDEPAPVSGRGVRSKQGKGEVEHGKSRATRGRVMHVHVRGGKSEKADWNKRFLIWDTRIIYNSIITFVSLVMWAYM